MPTEKHPTSVFVVTTQTDQRTAPEIRAAYRTEEAATRAAGEYVSDEMTTEYVAPGKSYGVMHVVVQEVHLRGSWGLDQENNARDIEPTGFVHGLMCAVSIVDSMLAPKGTARVDQIKDLLLAEVRSITTGANTADSRRK